MAEQVNIASLTINVDDVIKESVKLKKRIQDLKNSQKELKDSGQETSAAFVENEVQLKKLSKAYRDNQSFAVALDKANEDLNKTMEIEGKSTQQLRDDRAALNQISKNIKGDTEEEISLREKLNDVINKQSDSLKEQAPEYIKNKENIGGYTEGINAADFNLRSFIEKSAEAGGATNLLKGGLSAAKAGMIGFTQSAIAFIATPVGVVLAALVGAFLLVKNAMNRSEESTAKIQRIFGSFSGVAKKLLKFLQPLGDFLIDGLVKGFDLVEKGISKSLSAIERGLRYLGFDEAADKVVKFKEGVEEGAEAGRKMVEAELALQKAQRQSRKIQLEYQKEAEKLRQLRDDETRNIYQRIKDNEELGKVLKKQLQEELGIAQKALDLANLRIQLEGEETEALNERADAEAEIADIQERITGQQSEQLTNRVSLQKEAAQQAIDAQNAELEAYLKSQDVRKKTLEESIEIERVAAEKKKKILEDELKAKLKTQREYDAELTNINNELLKKQAELASENARRELQDYIEKNKSKIDSDKFLSESAFNEEKERLEKLVEQRKEFEDLKLEEGVINQIEYNDAINAINEENKVKNEELEKSREEAKKEKAAIDAENRLVLLEEQSAADLDFLTQKLESERLAEVEAAERSGADIDLINQKYALRQKKIEKSVNDAKIEGFGQVFESFASALGEQTAAGKAAAVASTLISTYQGAQAAYTSLAPIPVVGVGLGIAAAAAAVISGLKNVRQITSTPTKYSKGDILKGRSHSQGGIPFSIGGLLGFEAEGGEAIINKKSTSMFAPLLSEINAAGGGKRFASGGIAGSTTSPSGISIIDYDKMAESMAEAYESLPPSVLSVEEFNEVSSNVAIIEDLSTF